MRRVHDTSAASRPRAPALDIERGGGIAVALALCAPEASGGAPGDLPIPTNDHSLSLVSRHWACPTGCLMFTVPPGDVLAYGLRRR
jgi:hypothetical protein